MTKREWSDRDIDTLFSGQSPEGRDLARLKPMTDKIRSLAEVDGSAAAAQDFASTLARVARNSAESMPPARSRLLGTSKNETVTWRRRAGVAGLVALAASIGVAGTAAAADNAIPGDALYGVDRAFEAFGLGDGGIDERLDEAVELDDQGDAEEAIEHAAKALRESGEIGAADALLVAAEAVSNDNPGESSDTRASVSALLQFMASGETRGADFGAAVSERAKAIGGKPEGTPGGKPDGDDEPEDAQGGKPDGVGGGKPEGTPGGKPTDTASPSPAVSA